MNEFSDTGFPQLSQLCCFLFSNKDRCNREVLPRSSFTSHFSFSYHLRGNLFSVKELNRRVEHGREHNQYDRSGAGDLG